ncbi:hypothetical protein [Shinella zoogloeoides]|uniref:hypothetical protein n=1 Tax=Shinella zoogloeoides TaxID=352475 RepID=UPI00273E258C|nr:hypothetical protein [Shinella zoogloeoides]WLR92174.1 hypothetical protein Q9316_17160 [Shinella zoogloeoides]
MKTVYLAVGLALLAVGCLALLSPDVATHLATIPAADGVGFAMATLAANKTRDYQLGDKEEYPVVASDIIYQGAAVGENGSGYARPLVAGDPFLGFAEAIADNSAGAAGAIGVNVRKRGNIVLPISAIAITANDRPAVYASDDDTFTLTASTNTLIGYVSRWVSTGIAVVEFDAALCKAALQA